MRGGMAEYLHVKVSGQTVCRSHFIHSISVHIPKMCFCILPSVSKCGRAPTVVNGKPSSNEESYDYGAVIRYTCNPGFTIKGNKSIVCKGDEVFVPEPPQCISK